MYRCWPMLLALVLACGDDKTGDTDDGTVVEPGPTDPTPPTEPPTELPQGCSATVASVDPKNNATNHPADASITVTFSEAIEAADPLDITVHEVASGAMIPGGLSLAADGTSATFTPNDPLAYDTDYDLDITVCEAAVAGGFTTLPEPVDASLLPGRTYGIEYKDVVWVQPGDTSLLTLDVDYILVQIDTIDLAAETIESVAGTGMLEDDGSITPDCPAAVQAPTSDFSTNPMFTVGPADLEYPYNDDTFTIEQFTLQAQFSADGSQIVDVHIEGLVNPEQLLAGANCALAAVIVSGNCVPCPSGVGDCLELEATAATADWLPALDLITECAL